MKPTAISARTRMVTISGRRLRLLSAHSAFHSSLRFFFITIALRNGDMKSTVSTPVMALAYQWRSSPGRILWMKGNTKVNIRAMVAEVRME